MVASSYPRFHGDSVGSFMEPIAQGIARRGHEVHLVAPWHPKWDRPKVEGGVHFHLFHYAPTAGLNTFGYAEGMRADVRLRASAIAVAPLAVAAGWFKALRVARKKRATLMHAHWVVPGGVIGAAAAGSLPLVISLHGSDVFVAERHGVARMAARGAFARAGQRVQRGPARPGGRDRGRGCAVERSAVRRRQRALPARRTGPKTRPREPRHRR
jgi:hypothetical protein